MEIRALTEAERKYTYQQSTQISMQTGSIVNVHGGFDSEGKFYSRCSDIRPQWQTGSFPAELDNVLNALCSSTQYGFLQDISTLREYAEEHLEYAFPEESGGEYGFRVDTEEYAFLIRCNPLLSNDNFECNCYVKKWLNEHMKNAEKGIRFINSGYEDLFRIPDGGKIIITDSSGNKSERTCRFIDEYHTEIGNCLYHICQFAEIMECNGSSYVPAQAEEKDRKRAETDLQLTDTFGNTRQVQVGVNVYHDNRSLCVSLTEVEDGVPEPYGNITVNLDGTVPNYCAYVDTNNMPYIESFLVENGLAQFSWFSKKSGYCEYPLYMFNPDRLRELCPAGIAAYEAENGIKRTEKKKEKCR